MSISRRRSRSQSSTPSHSPRPRPLPGLPVWSYTPLTEVITLTPPVPLPTSLTRNPDAFQRMTTSTPPTPSATSYALEFFPSSRPMASASGSTNYALFSGELNQDNLIRLHREAYVSLRRSVAESDDSFVDRMQNWERSRSRRTSTVGGGGESSLGNNSGPGAAAVDPHNQYHRYRNTLPDHSHKRRKTAPSGTRAGPVDDPQHGRSHSHHQPRSTSHPRGQRWPRPSQTRKHRGFESDADSSSTPDDDEQYRMAPIPSSCCAVSFNWDEAAASGQTDMMDVEDLPTYTTTPALSMSSGLTTSLPYAEPFAREDRAIEELNRAMAAGAGSIDDYEDVRKAQGDLEEVDAGALWD